MAPWTLPFYHLISCWNYSYIGDRTIPGHPYKGLLSDFTHTTHFAVLMHIHSSLRFLSQPPCVFAAHEENIAHCVIYYTGEQ